MRTKTYKYTNTYTYARGDDKLEKEVCKLMDYLRIRMCTHAGLLACMYTYMCKTIYVYVYRRVNKFKYTTQYTYATGACNMVQIHINVMIHIYTD